ncbi:MAG: hypothetical protein ABI954_00145 [Pyrinomonadaceae bacterium]
MTPTLPAPTLTDPRLFAVSVTEDNHPIVESASAGVIIELSLWLAALQSFLQTENLPSVDAVNNRQKGVREWSSELRVLGWGLLKCSQIASCLRVSEKIDADSLAALQEVLHEADALCESLAVHGKVDFTAWTAWCAMLTDKLLQTEAVVYLLKEHELHRILPLPTILEALNYHPYLQGILGSDVREIFGRLFSLIEHLQLIEKMLKHDQPLKPALLLFALLHKETRNFLLQAERTLTILPPETSFHEVLDGTAYVIPMELRKVFNYELIGVSRMRQTPTIFARTENACGLLKDCFQQAVIALAQVFAPGLEAREVFPNHEVKIEQSIVLRRELWLIVKFVQKSEKSLEPELLAKLKVKLSDFRANTMPFLMFKDLETTERFIEEIIRTRRNAEIAQVLHRFGAYLETLLGQVNMRNVLSNHPFNDIETDF